MPAEKFIDIKPRQGLDSGLIPSAEPAEGMIWRDGKNAWFRDLTLEHTPGTQFLVANIGQSARALAQAFGSNGTRILYMEDLGIVSLWYGAAKILVGTLDPTGSPELEPWGDWLIASDNISPLKIWKSTGAFVTITDAATQFSRAKIVRKLAQHVLVYNTNILPSGFHWCSANNPDVWTPSTTNSARNLPIRNLDSHIVAVEPLGARHAVYSRNTLLLVQYIGPSQWFGTPNQSMQGIGAIGKHSVVSLGNYNFGISRAGIFMTDGNSFSYIDKPYIDKWLQSNADWTRGEEFIGYWDERLQVVVWSVPISTGKIGLTVDPKLLGGARPFSFVDGDFSFGLKREVFDFPIIAKSRGQFYTSITDTVAGDFQLRSHLFDAGDASQYKSWDYAIITGNIAPSSQIRFGFTDSPTIASIVWDGWMPISSSQVPFGPRESVYLAIEISATEIFKCSGLTVFGEKAGSIN